MPKNDEISGIVLSGIIIVVAIVLYFAVSGGQQSIIFQGGSSSYSVGQQAKMLYTLGASDWSFAKSQGLTCDKLKGKFFVYITTDSATKMYNLADGKVLTSSNVKCTYLDGSRDYCSYYSYFDFSGACNSGSSLQGSLSPFPITLANNYGVKIDWFSDSTHTVIFPYNSADRQSATFTATCPQGSINLGALGCGVVGTPTPYCGPYAPGVPCPTNTITPTQTAAPTQIPTATPNPCQPGPFCGMDGKTYADSCAANQQSGGIQSPGNCPIAPSASPTPTPSGNGNENPQLRQCKYLIGGAEYQLYSIDCKGSLVKGTDDLYVFIGIIGIAAIAFLIINKQNR